MASTLELLLMARMAATPVARAHATSTQSGIFGPVQITFGAVDFDNMGGFSGTGLYTVAVAGTYRCYGKAKFAATASTWVHLWIYHNGNKYAVGPDFPTTTASDYGGDVHDLVQCAVGDTLAIYGESQSTISTALPDTPPSTDVYFTVALESFA